MAIFNPGIYLMGIAGWALIVGFFWMISSFIF